MSDSPIKYKRNQRLLYITSYLFQHPNERIHLDQFTQQLNCAKSSISEDLAIIRENFQLFGFGDIETIAGIKGGIVYHPMVTTAQSDYLFEQIKTRLQSGRRILPGNYIYTSDLLQEPRLLDLIARLIAHRYEKSQVEVILTIEVKGIGLASAVARYLNVPYVISRRQTSQDEGEMTVVNYISGSHQKREKMVLSKMSLPPNSRVLIIDDFVRNGGTMQGLVQMVEAFKCECVGICMFAENIGFAKENLPDYLALVNLAIQYNADLRAHELKVSRGSFFDLEDEN